MANNTELDFSSLLHSLNNGWDTVKFEDETVPILNSADVSNERNALSGSVYSY